VHVVVLARGGALLTEDAPRSGIEVLAPLTPTMVEIADDEAVPFVEALENARCPECGATVEWQVNLDADGTTYMARHCDEAFYMVPHTYRFVVDDEE
jgi:hypothetical protein